MERTKSYFKRFRIDEPGDLEEYQEIVGDPLCHITDKVIQLEENKVFGEDGQLLRIEKFTTYLVSWEEKVI